jgi:large subunit ribosomal protein L21
MYAIVDIAGKQFKVEANKYLYAPLMEGQNGTQVSFDRVLLIDDGASVSVGTPVIKGASISGKIMEHVKGDKEIVFKKKRRKGYAKKNGHRQQYTRVMIESISSK